KESVFPFNRFPGVDAMLGPEMKSTGEVMGIDTDFCLAYAKSQQASGTKLPISGTVCISVKRADRAAMAPIVAKLKEMGFNILATEGTAKTLAENGVESKRINKVGQGQPHIVDAIKNGEIDLIINTPSGRRPRADEQAIRISAVNNGISLITTVTAASACVDSIERLRETHLAAVPIQNYLKDRINAVNLPVKPKK
ncbi:MAG TPA: carbamoyl phosphate synthase large subunit, partial [Phycisphaerae bacterium]|nr:carbamoyl phosphate synthase large subunit [Phycisphaerae bacterium]